LDRSRGRHLSQTAIEDLSDSFIELEESDVPANYVVRLRQEQAGLRKAALRIYHIQREEFLPSAYAMIVSFVIMIMLLLLFTTIEGPAETLVRVAFLTFFFVYLLRLLNVINKPFKVGSERNDDDVSLFLLYEFVVHARLADADLTGEQIVEIAEHLEEHEEVAEKEAAEAGRSGEDETTLTDLDEVVDAAVASVQREQESDTDRER
jgi:Ca2+/Na+ antiporter